MHGRHAEQEAGGAWLLSEVLPECVRGHEVKKNNQPEPLSQLATSESIPLICVRHNNVNRHWLGTRSTLKGSSTMQVLPN